MATIGHPLDAKTRSQRTHRKRLTILGFVLLALILFFVLSSVATHPWGLPDEEAPIDRSDRWPSDENVSSYISDQTIALPDTQNDPGHEPKLLAIRKEQIEGLKVKREDTFFTTVDFILKTDVGRFEVAALINHHPSDGMNVFDSFTVSRVVRR